MQAPALFGCAAMLLSSGTCFAQGYPARPIRLVVPFAPGGGADIAARLLSPRMGEALKQQVVVDNRPGAGTNIANEFVARSAPDGYTLLVTSPNLVVNMSLYKKLAFDTLRDFAPISVFYASPNILVVNSSFPVDSVRRLVALARARPGEINYSSAGNGTAQHLSGELFKLHTGVRITHVPFKGTSPSLVSLVGGEVAMSFASIPAIIQHVKSGRLRPLATTGAKRAELMPDYPTMKEAGVDMEVVVWYAMLAPAGTPNEIVQRLAELVQKIAADPDMRQRLRDLGAEPVGNTPEQFGQQLRREIVMWAEVVKAAGATVD
jgi:tripartite-type tricarboxylate transporter receptor subunit TctC